MMRNTPTARFRPLLATAVLLFGVTAASAETVAIKGESPALTVEVPDGFASSQTSRGIQAKTSDGAEYVWFETYAPDELDALVKEHEDYWTQNDVALGDDKDKVTKEFDGKTVMATDFKHATWKGKPTVVRYLFIDPNLPSKKLILMSVWASPEADQEYDAKVMNMISSLKIGE
jgi:hypothetical protein